jgi:Spx/MgsR family transcriptional regulator
MKITVYGIPNCDSVKRARVWLNDQGLDYEFHDFKKAGVPAQDLSDWCSALGWERVLNRAGTSWRKLDEVTRAGVLDSTSAQAVIMTQPSLIKRPLLRWADGRLTVGFSAELFAAHA